MSENEERSEDAGLDRLIPLAYEELRRVARQRMGALQPGTTLHPTDLVNEVLLRLLQQDEREYRGTDHLIRIAAQAMHNVLIDYARRRLAIKRGGHQLRRVELDDDIAIAAPAEDMLAFHDACEVVRERSQDNYELLLLRIYAGMTTREIATKRGQSLRTVERQWHYVKALLATLLNPTAHVASSGG